MYIIIVISKQNGALMIISSQLTNPWKMLLQLASKDLMNSRKLKECESARYITQQLDIQNEMMT